MPPVVQRAEALLAPMKIVAKIATQSASPANLKL
jgi:hypothetical protein